MTRPTTLIVGASHAGVTAAEALRRNGYDGRIRLYSAEAAPLPYHRPPLSKAYMAGEKSAEQIALRGAKFYADNDIELLTGTRVDAVDAGARSLRAGGETVTWDTLVLATGARARPLPGCEGITSGLHRLRDLADADRLSALRNRGGRLVIAGGGFIGLEVAATMVRSGLEVIVIDPLQALLRRALPADLSALLLARHRAEGVDIRLGRRISRVIAEDGALRRIELDDGCRIDTEDLLVGIGSTARLELAEQLGLATHAGGILVDRHGRSSCEGVYAIGDCAAQNNRFAGGLARIESVQAATDQARAVAAAICGKDDAPSAGDALPWFWSDQYDLKLQMAGLPDAAATSVMRGTPGDGPCSLFQMQQDRMTASFSINRAGDHVHSRKLIAQGARFDISLLADPEIPLTKCQLTEAAT